MVFFLLPSTLKGKVGEIDRSSSELMISDDPIEMPDLNCSNESVSGSLTQIYPLITGRTASECEVLMMKNDGPFLFL